MDYSPPGSSVHGTSQARILEWVAISFCWRSSWPRDWICICCTGRFFITEPPGKPKYIHVMHMLLVLFLGRTLTNQDSEYSMMPEVCTPVGHLSCLEPEGCVWHGWGVCAVSESSDPAFLPPWWIQVDGSDLACWALPGGQEGAARACLSTCFSGKISTLNIPFSWSFCFSFL